MQLTKKDFKKQIKDKNISIGYFSWNQALEYGKIYLYKSINGDIIPVTEIENCFEKDNNKIDNNEIDTKQIDKISFNKIGFDKCTITLVTDYVKTVTAETLFINMLEANLSLPEYPIDAWKYLISNLIYNSQLYNLYPILC